MLPDYEKLIADFVVEAEELLNTAETAILDLENNYEPEKVHLVFRAIHTLKGNSGMFDFQNVKELSHRSENLLDLIRSEKISLNKDIIDLLLKTIDKLKVIFNNIKQEKNFDVSELVHELEAIINQQLLPNTPSEPKIVDIEDNDINSNSDYYSNYIEIAKDRNLNLFHVELNLTEQIGIGLIDFISALQSLDENILQKKVISESLKPIEEGKDYYCLYSILLLSNKDPINLLAEKGIKASFIEIIHKTESFEIAKEQDTNQEKPLNKVTQNAFDAFTNLQKENSQESYLKVKIHLLDDLINLVGETIITRNQLLQRAAIINDSEGSVILSRMSQLITQLHEKIMRTRLQELNTVYQRITRIVRDTAKNLDKKVSLDLDGGEVELDKTMIDTILDALVHILRNSIDHGIESPEERLQKGKKETGIIAISASLQSGNVRLEIEDDGRGLNLAKIKESSVKKGLISREEADKLTKEEIEELIFMPGISTKSKVTETSGRGVGMDVVRSSFKNIGGTVHLKSEEGKGVKITAVIPQTVSVISCLLISVMEKKYALFQKYISELIKFDPSLYTTVNGHSMYRLRDKLLPIVHLGNLLYPDRESKSQPSYIVVVKSDNYFFGLLFDEMLGTEEIVIKPLGEHFSDLKLFSGATIMGDGEAVLILDVPGMADFYGMQSSMQDKEKKEELREELKVKSGYLLFESSGQYFATLSSSVVVIEKIKSNSIETLSGIDIIQYKNDIVPVIRLEDIYNIQQKELETNELYVIITSIGKRNIGIIIHRIIDVIGDINYIESSGSFEGVAIIGEALIDGHTTLVIDSVDLLSKLNKERFHYIGKIFA
ncbi:MAG: chemotaxis protein CheA [Leptospiraceae bacterium]|nr:chemotaxis protein CheA [Leptospiraceae bacterium]MCP5500366.1 chemotaxis protein CheA [Leptospiraceae bacterium]